MHVFLIQSEIRNFQFPLLITAFNFRSAVVITTLFSEHFPSPSLVDTPIPERQLQDRVTHNYVKPKEVQRLTVSTYHHIHPTQQ